jgi:hypothetical protein
LGCLRCFGERDLRFIDLWPPRHRPIMLPFEHYFPFRGDSPAMSAEPDVHGDAYRVGIADLCSGPQLPPWSTHSFGFSTEVAQPSERVRPPWRKSRCASRYTTGRMLQPLRRSKENRSETHPPDKDATLTNGVLSF